MSAVAPFADISIIQNEMIAGTSLGEMGQSVEGFSAKVISTGLFLN